MRRGLLFLSVAWFALAQNPPAGRRYSIDQANSFFLATTDKTGLFSFAAHRHAILATKSSVDLSIDENEWQRSSATITIPVSSLVIDSEEAHRKANISGGPSPDDVQKIQEKMLGPEVLDADRYPTIVLKTSSVVEGSKNELRANVELTMHGQTRQLTAPIRWTRSPEGSIEFTGDFIIRQSDFGLQPASIAGGTVKVKDEVRIRFKVSAKPSA